MKPSEPSLQMYALRLYERRNEAIMLKWADVSIGDWKPAPKECHGNATELCAHDTQFKPIRGWLYFDLGGVAGVAKFVAHSGVLGPDGVLYDITPSNASQQYPFICAEEDEQDYASLVESGVTELWYKT